MAANVPDYKTAVTYWSTQPTTVDGMLGGYGTGRVPRLDIAHSRLFLNQLCASGQLVLSSYSTSDTTPTATTRSTTRADASASSSTTTQGDYLIRSVDCGAGIGRVTRDLLGAVSDVVDAVEPCAPFTEEYLTGDGCAALRASGKIGTVYPIGLQDFRPPRNTYTLIWNQWCLGQLTDADLVAYLRRCRAALREDGHSVVCVKENLASRDEDEFDACDSSVTRAEQSFLRLFREAGLRVVRSSVQHGFPKELYKVKLWALK